MSKKTSKHSKQAAQQSSHAESALNYYAGFHCIGPDCEDSCCIGWRIDIDKSTFEQYQSFQTEPLASRVAKFVELKPDTPERKDDKFAHIGMLPNKHCAFLQEDGWCMIQKEKGSAALSEVCSSFPRHIVRFCDDIEYGLDVSCPEAARRVLLPSEPLRMKVLDQAHKFSETDADLKQRGYLTLFTRKADAKHNLFRRKLRKLIVRILQYREAALNSRMLLLGELFFQMENAIRNPNFQGSHTLLPMMSQYEALLNTRLDERYAPIEGRPLTKLQVTTAFLLEIIDQANPRLRECILACVSGLTPAQAGASIHDPLSLYRDAHEQYFQPFMHQHGHMLENYLVNDVFINLVPFVCESYTSWFRSTIFNLTLIQFILIGMAAHRKGLTEADAVKLIQSFTRISGHNQSYLDKLQYGMGCDKNTTIPEMVWLLKDF